MKRNELFDILLKNRAESDTNGYMDLLQYTKSELKVDNRTLVESIVDEMIQRGWVTTSNYSRFSTRATYNGKKVIEDFGSYSSFLQSENTTQKRTQRSKTTPTVISIGIAIIFGLSTALLGWLKYFDDKTIDTQKNEIERLNNSIDSLENEIKTRHTTIDKKHNQPT